MSSVFRNRNLSRRDERNRRKNSAIPVKKEKQFTTVNNKQEMVILKFTRVKDRWLKTIAEEDKREGILTV